MTEITALREFLDAIIAAFAVLGGTMAYYSGMSAVQAQAAGAHGQALADAINEGIADGFVLGVLFSVTALIIAVWTT